MQPRHLVLWLAALGLCLAVEGVLFFILLDRHRDHRASVSEFAIREAEVGALARSTGKQRERVATERKELEEHRLELLAREAEIEALQAELEAALAMVEAERKVIAGLKARGTPPSIAAGRALVVDARSGAVLFEHNPDKREQIASTQKLLTALVVLESGNLDSVVTIVEEDTDAEPTKIGLEVGEQFTRRELLTALLVRSYNDIAEALARDCAGSVAAFVERMNAKAGELGCVDSHFANPHGLPDDSQYSTPRDLARIARAVDGEPELREMVATEEYILDRDKEADVELTNTNRVLRDYPPCDGMKTGYTRAAGFCLVASGELGEHRRIVIVLNDSRDRVWSDARALLEWGLKG